MTGMDLLLASLTPDQLAERCQHDLAEANTELSFWADELFAEAMRWLIEDLEKRIGE
jgi:hypothetical protein